ncbi:MAG: rRNA adenine N-6-methyltransferase family protein [Patescibacteria group bacterium]|jgi:16S rRNA A1518/A1519 N6-dimethyltransferase RsmA/KsgA/DIM1 with predicted DNA glycosylase/AP lyase activity
MLIYIIILIIILVIFIFSSKTLSPIPYFPSQPVDIPLIVKALNLKNNQILIDLGAGDGIVIFKAASESLIKKLNTKFVAVEINPILILILYIRKFFHPNRKNIKIVHDDIFKMNFDSLTREPVNSITVYLYISPWFLEKTVSNIKKQISKFSVISYMYSIKSLKKKERIISGKNKIFIY